VILLAFGEHKAPVIARAVEGPVSTVVAASYLQQHSNARIYLDEAAAAELTRFRCPWTLTTVQWDEKLIRKAVIWLARQLEKPVLKLTDEDYSEHGLAELLASQGPAYTTNLEVFRDLQETITGWPGGKPAKLKRPGDISRPTDRIYPKRVVVFSPHPDDDVISMGGTLIRLVDQGHDVHVAYQTSGNIAVFDADTIRFAEFATEFNRIFGMDAKAARKIEQHVEQFLKKKKPGQVDSEELLKIKSAIRSGEARAAARYCGIPAENAHFLDMPFYETGKVRKRPLCKEDIQIIVNLLRKVKPHQIYSAGDLSDPHGTHRVCLSAIFQALEVVKKDDWFADCEVWLYRGAWQEWEPERIDMAVPLSPHEVVRKREAIFKHQSQKDRALFPGTDDREFWERAEARNKATAKLYDALGLAEYEAIEAFVRFAVR
jgi:glucosamine-6-phosphate deaminase